MFKKPFKISQSNQISNKDKKKLMSDLKKQFPSEVIELFFKTYDKFQQEKVEGQKMLIYQTDTYPAFFKTQGNNEFIPSLYVIAEFPELLPPLLINQGVESYLINGANLMWRGVAEQDFNFKKDDQRIIVTTQGSLVAIGLMSDDSIDVNTKVEQNDLQAQDQSQVQEKSVHTRREGIAAFILHTIGDYLWENGPKKVPEPKILSAFAPEMLEKKEETLPEQQDEQQILLQEEPLGQEKSTVQNQQETKQFGLDQFIQEGDDSEDDPNNKRKKKNKKAQPKSSKLESQKDNKIDVDKDKDKEEEAEGLEDKNLQQIDVKAMDEYIKEAFLNTLMVGIKDIQFPIDSSLFYSNYMLHYKNQDIVLDLKNSSYKKIGKFFTQMHKEGLIEYREANKNQQTLILSVNSKNKELINWKPTMETQVTSKEIKKDEPYGFQPQIQVTELFKPKKMITEIFKDQPKDRYYTKDEWVLILNDYILKECKWQKKQVELLDPFLPRLCKLCEIYQVTQVTYSEPVQQQTPLIQQIDQFPSLQQNQNSSLQQNDFPSLQQDQFPSLQQNQFILPQQNQKPSIQQNQKPSIQQQNQKPSIQLQNQKPSIQQQNQKPSTQQQFEKPPVQQQQKILVSLQNNLVSYDVLLKKFQENMTLSHEITNLNTLQTQLKPGQFQGLNIKAQRCHNKNITKLTGLEIFGFDPNLKDSHPNSFNCLIETFQVRFACSVSVCHVPNSHTKEMIIHGNFIEEAVLFFTKECQINQNFISQVNKLQPKKKNIVKK